MRGRIAIGGYCIRFSVSRYCVLAGPGGSRIQERKGRVTVTAYIRMCQKGAEQYNMLCQKMKCHHTVII
eukprot:3117329-Prymnesium_polylepis.4